MPVELRWMPNFCRRSRGSSKLFSCSLIFRSREVVSKVSRTRRLRSWPLELHECLTIRKCRPRRLLTWSYWRRWRHRLLLRSICPFASQNGLFRPSGLESLCRKPRICLQKWQFPGQRGIRWRKGLIHRWLDFYEHSSSDDPTWLLILRITADHSYSLPVLLLKSAYMKVQYFQQFLACLQWA